MTNRIENLLIYTLEQAAQAVADARKELAGREAEVAEVTALLADHRRRNAPPAPTEAFPAVPPRSGSVPPVPDRSGSAVWDDSVAPGGYVCAVLMQPGSLNSTVVGGDFVCGMPVESEPCPIHGSTARPAPPAAAAATVTDPPADETPKDGA